MGIRLAIERLRHGYSSLASIKRFPFDCIKIDRSFIKDIPQDRTTSQSRRRSSRWRTACGGR